MTGFIQGAGLGLLFVPLTTVTFATLEPEQRADGTGLYNLSRNIGSSVGISVVSYLLIRNNQVNHATMASHVTAFNHAFDNRPCCRRGARGPPADARRLIRSYKRRLRSSAHQRFQIDDDPFARGHFLLVQLLRSAPPAQGEDHAMVME